MRFYCILRHYCMIHLFLLSYLFYEIQYLTVLYYYCFFLIPNDVWLLFQWGDIGRDGRRAPIADYLRFTRSIDTQTPARGSALSTASSNHTSPSLSPPTSPQAAQAAAMPPSTPSPTNVPPLATSPHINKFLAREPPDGCEKVALKLHEDRYDCL